MKEKPKRSAIFLAVTAEEKGLLGSKYYSQNPIVPLGKTAINLNFDMILPLGIPESLVLNGAERTTVWPTVKATAEKHKLEIEADNARIWAFIIAPITSRWARAGVPAFSVGGGSKIKGKPADFAMKKRRSSTTRGTTHHKTKYNLTGTSLASR